jgi:hypothetical protein
VQVLLFATPTLAAVFSFAAYGSAEPNNFTPNHIFSAIAYFSIMRFPLVRPQNLAEQSGVDEPSRILVLPWHRASRTNRSPQSDFPATQVFLPFALVQLGNAMVSMRRLNQYLVMEERTDEVGVPQLTVLQACQPLFVQPCRASGRARSR